jgi:hypothetical protein
MEHIGILHGDIVLFAVRFRPGCLRELPWHNQPFDCSVLCVRPTSGEGGVEAIASEVAAARTEWVHVLGKEAQVIHDAVDRSSVNLGRQAKVGDGVPMTSWHDDLQDLGEIAAFVVSGGLGLTCDYHLALVVGSENDYRLATDAIRQCYESRKVEDT